MDWWIDFYRDMDSLEIERSSAWYGEDIELRAGNGPAILGKEAATAALNHVLQQLQSLRHDLGTVVTSGNDVFLECHVNYVFKTDGTSLYRLPRIFVGQTVLSEFFMFSNIYLALPS